MTGFPNGGWDRNDAFVFRWGGRPAARRDGDPGMNRLPRSRRLGTRAGVSELFESGRRGSHGVVAARTRDNGIGQSRLVAAAGKKLGNAVKRNRMRRLLRAAFRMQQDALPSGIDIALVSRPGLLEARWREILEAVREAVWKAEAGRGNGRRR